MTEVLILDAGNVAMKFFKMKACIRLAASSPYSPQEVQDIIATKLEKQLESGQMSESAFCNAVLHDIKSSLTVPDVMRIWGNIITPNPYIDRYVDQLIKRGVRIAILSNTNGIHWPYIMDVPVFVKLQHYGAPFILSHEVHASKPDRRIFDVALERCKIEANQALYVDDIMQYVEVARSLGMKSEQYDCTRNHPSRFEEILKTHDLL